MTKKQVESQNCKYFKVSGKKVRYFPLNDEVVWSASGRLGEVCMKEYIRYEETTFQKLLQDIKAAGYSLPTKREWEYLAGKGCRSIFPWGNNMDFSMKLRHLEWMDNNDEYSLEKENFFGLHIAFDPYCREIVYDKGVFAYKGGDGGRNICGGLGIVWGYFPVSPYFEDNENELGNFINGGYDFFRRVIRITDDFGD